MAQSQSSTPGGTSRNHEEELPSSQLPTEPPSIEVLFAKSCCKDETAATNCSCTNHEHSKANSQLMTTEHFRDQLKKLRSICGVQGMMNLEVNSIFLKRLEEIDGLDPKCCTESLRLTTFQDWVDLLLHINYVVVANMTDMESEAYQIVINSFKAVRGEQQQVLDENRSLRKDICAIIKLVQTAYHHNIWNTGDIALETLTVDQLLGIQADLSVINKCETVCESHKNTSMTKTITTKTVEFSSSSLQP